MSIVVEHVSEYVLGVLEALGHLCIVRLEGLVEGQSRALALFVDVGY